MGISWLLRVRAHPIPFDRGIKLRHAAPSGTRRSLRLGVLPRHGRHPLTRGHEFLLIIKREWRRLGRVAWVG